MFFSQKNKKNNFLEHLKKKFNIFIIVFVLVRHRTTFKFIFTKLSSGQKESCQNACSSAKSCSNMVNILVKMSKKGGL